jgi:hypothetical protein
MFVNCEIILRRDATPEQQRALGVALWPWSRRAAGAADICRHLNKQAAAGQVRATEPSAQYAGLRRVQFLIRGDPAYEREPMLQSLRRVLPREGVADVLVDGISWRLEEVTGRTTTAA